MSETLNPHSGKIIAGQDVIDTIETIRAQISSKQISNSSDIAAAVRIDETDAFGEFEYDLSQFVAPRTVDFGGRVLRYKLLNSHPGGRINIQGANLGKSLTLNPGSFVKGSFKPGSFTISLAKGSAAEGAIVFFVEKQPSFEFGEAPLLVQDSLPAVLLGTIAYDGIAAAGPAIYSFVPINISTDPTTVPNSEAQAFFSGGYSRIRVLLDCFDGVNTATSFDLVPFSAPTDVNRWFEQGTGRISVPDVDSAGSRRFRSIVFDVSGTGFMSFAYRNVVGTPGIPASIGIIVQGIEK